MEPTPPRTRRRKSRGSPGGTIAGSYLHSLRFAGAVIRAGATVAGAADPPRAVVRPQRGKDPEHQGREGDGTESGHHGTSVYLSISGCQRAMALLMIWITARDEMVAPVIISTS